MSCHAAPRLLRTTMTWSGGWRAAISPMSAPPIVRAEAENWRAERAALIRLDGGSAKRPLPAPTDPEDEATATRATRAGATAEVADLRAGRTADARDFRILSASWMSKIGLHANFSAARNRSRK